MSTLALYRKYRPQTFAEVVGQDHVVSVLQEALANGTIAHAYLFSGPRGTGKTSIARILAHELGCSPNDLHEVDAASNRGIDDIRELREAVKTMPFDSPRKVYIVDEVHMLTKEAFNALLKTLEEPPRHVVFMLATTEIEKLPDTVVSRCQTFVLKQPSQEMLQSAVIKVAAAEGVAIEPAGADLIALLGDGSFRDALGVLQKVLSSSGSLPSSGSGTAKKITEADVERVTSAPRGALVNSIISAMAEKKVASALAAVSAAADSNVDFTLLVKLLLKKMRCILLLRFAPEMRSSIAKDISPDDLKFLETLAGSKDSGISSATISRMLDVASATPRAIIQQLPLELALVQLLDA